MRSKRSVWVSLFLVMAVGTGCGDSSTTGGGDGGVGDGGDTQQQMLQDDLDQLSGNLGDVDDAVKGLQDRIEDLETTPEPASCSEGGETCVTDGIDMLRDDLEPLARVACRGIFQCCNEDEVFYRLGGSIEDVDACVAAFRNLASRGATAPFIASPLINLITQIGSALNTPSNLGTPSITLIPDGIDACADEIRARECPEYVAPPDDSSCRPYEAPAESACMAEKMVQGLLAEGESCNTFLTGAGVPQCAAGLTCRALGAGLGICVQESVEGDVCVNQGDCNHPMLFCNQKAGVCQELGDAGDDCSYVDPDLILTAAEAEQCRPPFTCDPLSEKCVEPCSRGTQCVNNDQCPGDLVCDRTSTPLYYYYSQGFCRPAFRNGVECNHDDECRSGFCDDNSGECSAPLKAAGEDCAPAAAFDATCESNYCGQDGTCARECYDGYAVGDLCEDDEFCSSTLGDVCVPRLTDGSTCGDDDECMDGSWCDFYQMCTPQIANGALCSSYNNRECANGFCAPGAVAPYYYECTPFLAAGDDCASFGNDGCGPDAFCFYDATATPLYQCTAYAQEGEDCELYTPPSCAPSLTCNGDPNGAKCYEYGNFPDGAYCVSSPQCASGNCLQNACSGASTPLNGDCDVDNVEHAPCEPGTYCKTADADTTDGVCKPQRSVGKVCESRYRGRDCLGNVCEAVHGGLYCGGGSIEPETLMCDGIDG